MMVNADPLGDGVTKGGDFQMMATVHGAPQVTLGPMCVRRAAGNGAAVPLGGGAACMRACRAKRVTPTLSCLNCSTLPLNTVLGGATLNTGLFIS